MNTSPKSLSVVVPVFNEHASLTTLFSELKTVLSHTQLDWEVIFVDDGSTDKSLEILRTLAAEQSTARQSVRYLAFTKNCGQSTAFAAGFTAATGDIIITIDADLQNDPADIPHMLEEYNKGHDMVIGWRAQRQDTMAKRLASHWANAIRNWLSHETIKDTGCSLKLMRSSMAKEIPMFTGMHRFLPTLMKLQGAHVAEVKVNHRPRVHGTSKYGVWSRGYSSFFDLLAVRWMQKRHCNYTIREQQ